MQFAQVLPYVVLLVLADGAALAQSTIEVDPKGRFAAYVADADTDGVVELYHATLGKGAGTGAFTRLNGPLPPGGDVTHARLDPKGRRVVYRADQDTDEVFELYGSNLKTGEVARVSGDLVPGGSVLAPPN